MRTALAILLGSRLAGCQTLTELSDFGRALRPADPRRDRLPGGAPQTGRYEAPCISSWHDLLKRIDRRRGGAFAGGLDSRASAGQSRG